MVPKVDFPSHKLSGTLMKVALTESSTFIHALQRDRKPRTTATCSKYYHPTAENGKQRDQMPVSLSAQNQMGTCPQHLGFSTPGH